MYLHVKGLHRCTEASFLAFTFGKWSNYMIFMCIIKLNSLQFLYGTCKNTHIHVEIGSGTSKVIKSIQSQ